MNQVYPSEREYNIAHRSEHRENPSEYQNICYAIMKSANRLYYAVFSFTVETAYNDYNDPFITDIDYN